MIVQYAIILYLTKETGSATILSIATILGMLPMALLSPFVGPLVDRWNKRRPYSSFQTWWPQSLQLSCRFPAGSFTSFQSG